MVESRDPAAPSVLDVDASRLFQALVIETPPAERLSALRGLCQQHPDLAPRLESLYSCWEIAAQLLESDGDLDCGQAAAHSLGVDSKDLEDRYATGQTVGRGGMGVVQSAYDQRLRRDVAIKRPSLAPTAAHVRRFLREGLVTARLDHPAIVPVHDLGTDSEGRPWLSMKLVRGQELGAAITEVHEATPSQQDGGQTPARLVEYLLRACEALSYAHAQGVVHRDLKPSNIMIGEFGEVFVMDWGLAAVLDDGAESELPVALDPVDASDKNGPGTIASSRSWRGDLARDLVATQAGEVLGTLHYMAPEQARETAPTPHPALDVFGIGAILHEIAVGLPPHHDAADARELLARVRQGTRAAPPEACATCPVELVAISQRAMASQPEDRYPTMQALIEDLRAFVEGRVVAAHDTSGRAQLRKWIGRHRARTALIATLVLGLPLITWLAARAIYTADDVRAARQSALASEFEEQLAMGFAWSPMDRDRSAAIRAFDHALALEPGSEIAAIGKARALGERSEAHAFLKAWLGDRTPSVGIRLWLDGNRALQPELREQVIASATNDVDAYVIGLALLAARDREAVADARKMFTLAALSAARPRIIYQEALLQTDRLLGDRAAMHSRIVALRANWSEQPVSMLARSLAWSESGDPVRARKLADGAVERRPGWLDAHYVRAWLALQRDDATAGLEAVGRALEIGPRSPRLLYLEARLRALSGDVEDALRIAREAHGLDPEDPAGCFHVGTYLQRLGNPKQALALYEEALSRWPSPDDDLLRNIAGDMRPRLHTNRGAALLAIGRLDEARQALEQALQLDTRSWETGYQYAILELGRGDVQSAREHLQDADSREPNSPLVRDLTLWLNEGPHISASKFESPNDLVDAQVNIGRVAYFSRRLVEGTEILSAATRLDPRSHRAWHWLAATLMYRGAYDQALGPLGKALELQPDSVNDGTNLGIAFTRLGRFDDARRALHAVLQQHPRFGRAHLWLGIVAFRERRFQAAIDQMRKGYELASKDSYLIDQTVHHLVLVGRFEEAYEIAKGSDRPTQFLKTRLKALAEFFEQLRAPTTKALENAARSQARSQAWHAATRLFQKVMATSDAKRAEWAVPAARVALNAAKNSVAAERERLHMMTLANLRHRIATLHERVAGDPKRAARWRLELGTYSNKQGFPMGERPLPTEPKLRRAWTEFQTMVRREAEWSKGVR